MQSALQFDSPENASSPMSSLASYTPRDQSRTRKAPNLESDRGASLSQPSLADDATSRIVRVCIPAAIHAEIAASDLRELEKLIVYQIIYESATTSVQGKSISVKMLNKMAGIGDRGRARIKRFLKSSANFGWIPYEVDERCEFWFVKGFSLGARSMSDRSVGAQHTSDVPCGVWCGDVVWRSVDLGLMDWMVVEAKKGLGWDCAERNAKTSLEQIELVGLPESNDELMAEAVGNIKVPIGRNKKNAEKKAKEARERAKTHVAQIRLFETDPAANIQRKSGRLYTRLTSLPRWARKRYVKFSGGRRAESVDIRCCYPWCIAAKLRQKRLKRGLEIESLNRLLDLIESGGFYEELARRAGMPASQAKKSFAVMCLFGDPILNHWGRNRLWFALDAICPEICDEISRWRRQTAGEARLANYCQRLEGAIMLNGLVPVMAEAGIACCTIHDGCLVPEGHGEFAAQVIRDRAASLFGRPCFVKVESL